MTVLGPGGVSRQLFSNTPVRRSPAENGGHHRPQAFEQTDEFSANGGAAARALSPSLSRRSRQSAQRSTGSYRVPIDDQQRVQHGSGQSKHVSSYRVPSDSDSDAEEADSDAMSSHIQAAPIGFRVHPVQAAANSKQRGMHRQFSAAQEACQAYLARPLGTIASDLVIGFQNLALYMGGRKAQLQGSSAQARAEHASERQRRLDDLQQRQQQTQEQQERKIAEAKRAADEAAAREAAERARRQQKQQQQEQQRQQEEAARKLKEQEAKRQAEQQQQQQQQQQHKAQEQAQQQATAQAAAAAAKQPQQPPSGVFGPAPGIVVRVAASAAAAEKALAAKLEVAEAVAKELSADAALKQQRRALEKRITLLVSQISGTTTQVEAKARDLLAVIQSQSGHFRTLACLTLAARVVSQCEGQIARISSFAFPVAMVVVMVAATVPEVMELLLARLHKACILTVPKYYGWRPSGGTSQEQYFEMLGYQQVEDAKAPGGKRLESEDEFVARMTAYVLLYAAIVQVEVRAGVVHPCPLEHGWTYIAQLLNNLQPNRATASALMAFLTHAGYRMHQQYGRQFVKLLHAVHDNFLPDLEAKGDADARAVVSRLSTYLHSQQFKEPPAGRTLRKMDESSYARA